MSNVTKKKVLTEPKLQLRRYDYREDDLLLKKLIKLSLRISQITVRNTIFFFATIFALACVCILRVRKRHEKKEK